MVCKSMKGGIKHITATFKAKECSGQCASGITANNLSIHVHCTWHILTCTSLENHENAQWYIHVHVYIL